MSFSPTSLKEAREWNYGFSFEKRPYKEGKCAHQCWSGGRGSTCYQCTRKNGHGPEGLFCRQHAPETVAAKRKAQQEEWEADAKRCNDRLDRQAACVRACAGISDPEKAIAEARKTLEAVATFFAGMVPHCQEETALRQTCYNALELLTPSESSRR